MGPRLTLITTHGLAFSVQIKQGHFGILFGRELLPCESSQLLGADEHCHFSVEILKQCFACTLLHFKFTFKSSVPWVKMASFQIHVQGQKYECNAIVE